MMLTLLQIIGEGTPVTYSPRKDDFIALVLLLCFFMSSFVLARSRKQMLLQAKSFMFQRERASIFADAADVDGRFQLLLLLQTCVFGGLFIFNYFNDVSPRLMVDVVPFRLMGIYIGCCVGYLVLKWLVYQLIGWVFLDKNRTDAWLSSYSTLIYYFGFALFPFVLLLIYFDLQVVYLVTIGLFLGLFVKLLMFYKWVKLFFNNYFSLFLLILYFCALEIIPCLLLYRGLLDINNLLTIKL